MPECNNCGNTREFKHSVAGDITRVYESGEVVDVAARDLQTTGGVFCEDCGSADVTFDSGYEK